MKRTAAGWGIVVLLALGSAAPAGAQALAQGTWTGTMAPPGGEAIPVNFEVSESGGALSIAMMAVQVEGEMPFRDIQLTGQTLTFWWEVGVRVDCSLTRTQAGGFEGTCSDGTGDRGEGTLTMVPPA